MKDNKPKVVYIDFGVAYRGMDGTVYLNKGLENKPYLHDLCLEHELGHSPINNVGDFLRNVWYDLTDYRSINPWLLLWIIKTPSSWSMLSPINYRISTKEFHLNLGLLFTYILLMVTWITIIYINTYEATNNGL